jgi:hypothetical protein
MEAAMPITCHVVVVEDLERNHGVGEDMIFAVLPRIGETLSGLGTVVDVVHYPSRTSEREPETRVQLFITRESHNSHVA